MSTGGESIFRGEGITVEDEFTNDTFDDEEEGGEGWLEDGDEVREGHLDIFILSSVQVKGEEIEGLEEPYLLLLPPDPESDTEQPPPSRSLQNRVIHIQVELTAAVHCSVERQNLYILFVLGKSRLCQASSLWTAKFWSTIRLKFKAGAQNCLHMPRASLQAQASHTGRFY